MQNDRGRLGVWGWCSLPPSQCHVCGKLVKLSGHWGGTFLGLEKRQETQETLPRLRLPIQPISVPAEATNKSYSLFTDSGRCSGRNPNFMATVTQSFAYQTLMAFSQCRPPPTCQKTRKKKGSSDHHHSGLGLFLQFSAFFFFLGASCGQKRVWDWALLLTSCHSVSPLTGCFQRYTGVGCIFFVSKKGGVGEAMEEVEISSKSMGIIDGCLELDHRLEMAQDGIVCEVHMVIGLWWVGWVLRSTR